MSRSQSETIDLRRGAFSVLPSPDRRSVTVTLHAPRDGGGRQTYASDLSVILNAREFDQVTKDFVFINAGLERGK
jgi:hypothetical protein